MPGGRRSLVWIEGPAEATRRRARRLLDGWPAGGVGWVGGTGENRFMIPTGAIKPLPVGQGRQLLGQTLLAGVLDAHDGLDPDDLGALAGTIDGQGLLILLSLPAREWPARAAPAGSVFIQRLVDQLEQASAVQRPVTDTPLPAPALPPGAAEALQPTADQQQVITAVMQLSERPDGGTLLVTADRGRGKSAALGLAAKAITGRETPRLSAPSRSAAATALAHAGPSRPQFLAPEAVGSASSLLMIDEAAALPLPRVIDCINANRHCVLTGTVHGYEGSGRGLTLRLAGALADRDRPFTHLHLAEPVRWAMDDPLEALVDRLLLLSVEPDGHGSAGTIRVGHQDRSTLAAREGDLRDAFGLLVAGHYQTRPRDLQQLLDDPAVTIHVARDGGRIVGVLAARTEGGMDDGLCHEIHRGRRRPAGHLIAQSLTFHAGVSDAAAHRGWRIQRIAVHPDCQRQGIGRRLVDSAREAAAAAGMDWLGTSFGMTPSLIDFWTACGLLPVRVGNRRDARSGAFSIIQLQGLTPAGQRLQARARECLAVHLPDQLNHSLRDLSVSLRERLSIQPPSASIRRAVNGRDLAAFADGHRSLLDTHAALGDWWASFPLDAGVSATDRALLAAAVETPLDPAAIARAGALSGRREAIARLRQLIAQHPRIPDE